MVSALARSYPIQVTTLEARTGLGRDLMASHRGALSPLVLLDGEFFSQGRLPRRKLAKVLSQRFDMPTRSRGA